jgi:hypothetical protein
MPDVSCRTAFSRNPRSEQALGASGLLWSALVSRDLRVARPMEQDLVFALARLLLSDELQRVAKRLDRCLN